MKISRIRFWFKRFLTDVRENRNLPVSISSSPKLDNYYIVFREHMINSRGGNKPLQFDAQGIPMIHTYIDVEDAKGYYYYPITIGQYALAVFHEYLIHNEDQKKDHFLRIADWFISSVHFDAVQGAYWLTESPKPEYKINQPWMSAFAQSRAISVLLRAWQLTDSGHYLDLAESALIPFTKDIQNGGVAAHLDNDHPFYEEYVADEPTMVLDGHMFALFGINDFIRSVPSDRPSLNLATKIFNRGIDSLLYWLPEYDLGYWLRFNLCGMDHYPKIDPCTIGYLRLACTQLEILHKITENKELGTYASKFRSYDRFINYLRMYKLKYPALKKLNRV